MVLVVATDKDMVFFYYRGCIVAQLFHTQALCIPLCFGFICGLGWGSFLVLLQETCRFGVSFGVIRRAFNPFNLLGIFCLTLTGRLFKPQTLIYFYYWLLCSWSCCNLYDLLCYCVVGYFISLDLQFFEDLL